MCFLNEIPLQDTIIILSRFKKHPHRCCLWKSAKTLVREEWECGKDKEGLSVNAHYIVEQINDNEMKIVEMSNQVC
ncbi:hypothetical protein CQA44_10655 [Helicobacter sp. MIT 14-3879]|nr:hypothetical protein CQA44_10655 [Helicobacter sp. MIT 14-3879]